MKRKIAILLILAIIMTICPTSNTSVMAASDTGNMYSFTSENNEVTISFREVKDNDYWYEYYITVTNQSSQSICDWSIEMSCSDVSKFSKGFECSATKDEAARTLTVKGSGNNKVVAAGSSVSSSESFKLGFGSAVTFSDAEITYSYGNQSSVEDVAGGVGYGNTYLEGYRCNYSLTGELQDMAWGDTPVGKHGKLHVSGTQLMDENDQPTLLRGASTHGMHWGEMTPFVNKTAFQNLRDEWGVDMVRLVSYVTQGGYTEGAQETLDTAIQNGVSYTEELGLYAIIDWHIHAEDPNTKKAEAITFFDKYSKMYKDKEHVIYEICNEPTGTPWSSIKSYAEDVVATIRANDDDAIIIVGTNTWSQDVDEVATNGGKLEESNVMYTIHFYSGTHGQSLRDKVTTALNAGTPVFCTEFGICDASGNGVFNVEEANTWIDFFEEKGISYSCWSLCNKDESASMISPQSAKTYGWTNEDLGATGAWLINTYRSMRGEEETVVPSATPKVTAVPEETARASAKPEITQQPVVTQEPENTQEPTIATAAPGVTLSPIPSIKPEETNVPMPIQTPGNAGEDVVPTQTPGDTGEDVIPTKVPGSTSTPRPSVVPTNPPVYTVVPEATEIPKTTETANPAISVEEYAVNSALLDTKAKVVAKGKKMLVSWGKVSNATCYEVNVGKCGAKTKVVATIVSSGKVKATIKKIAGKKIQTAGIYEVQVCAYRMVNGEKQLLATSTALHVAGAKHKKYTNVKKIIPKKKKLTLKKGKKVKVKAKRVKQSRKKKLLAVKHAKKIRYMTSDKRIATVSKNGKVKARGKGKCVIYVIAPNGVRAKVNVKVKG